MWNRTELKARGRAAFRANYWKCVLVAFILFAIMGGTTVKRTYDFADSEVKKAEEYYSAAGHNLSDTSAEFAENLLRRIENANLSGTVARRLSMGVGIFGILFNLLLFNPLQVGCYRFFLENSRMPADLNELAWAFKNSYGRNVLSMFLKNLYGVLWAFLFVIPGIIKTYSYRLVPYILAEDPSMDANDAITLSRHMMNGHKWRTFVLDLSFFGWQFLSVLTLGILGIFYVEPYVAATDAELYRAIKERA